MVMLWRVVLAAFLIVALPGFDCRAESGGSLRAIALKRGHSEIIEFESKVITVAVGNPDIVGTLMLTPHRVLINGLAAGATSVTAITENDYITLFQVQVTHDLTVLEEYLRALDERIEVRSDPNGDAVLLIGTVATQEIADKAVEATVRFLGTSSITLGNVLPEEIHLRRTSSVRTGPVIPEQALADLAAAGRDRPTGAADGEDTTAAAANETIYAETSSRLKGIGGARPFQETVESGTTRVVNLLVPEDRRLPPAVRLQALLNSVNPDIRVEHVNDVFVLKGRVRTPAEMTRALVLADRFVGGTGDFKIRVVSDRGGVLAGDIRPDQPSEAAEDLQIRGFTRPSSDPKGNLAQNIARGDVVIIADGRVMSMLTLEKQPRVEIRMRIVAIDRNKTDKMGINWRIDGTRVSVGSLTGNLVPVLPGLPFGRRDAPLEVGPGVNDQNRPGNNNDDEDAIDTGASNLVGFFAGDTFSISAFIQALEDRGAAKTLSEPLLTAVSGESASFLVGGEIPILSGSVSTDTNSAIGGTTTTTQNVLVYRDFGIQLTVRPTVLDNGRISITLDQVLSEPSTDNSIIVEGVRVPSFNKRSVNTLTEAQDGDTWAVAGLLSAEDTERLQGVPWLSKVPILGALFRSTEGVKARSELMITVTARQIPDGYYAERYPPVSFPEFAPETGDRNDRAVAPGLIDPRDRAAAPVSAEGAAASVQPAAVATPLMPEDGGRRRWFHTNPPAAPISNYRPFGLQTP